MMPDWFALGVMLYKLMVRKGPFDAVGDEYKAKDEWTKRRKAANYVEPKEYIEFKAKVSAERNRRICDEEPHPFNSNPEHP